VRLVAEHRSGYPTKTAAVAEFVKMVETSGSRLRRWMAQAEVDAGDRSGDH